MSVGRDLGIKFNSYTFSTFNHPCEGYWMSNCCKAKTIFSYTHEQTDRWAILKQCPLACIEYRKKVCDWIREKSLIQVRTDTTLCPKQFSSLLNIKWISPIIPNSVVIFTGTENLMSNVLTKKFRLRRNKIEYVEGIVEIQNV